MELSLLSSSMTTRHLAAHLTVLEIASPLDRQELLAVCSLHRLSSLRMCCCAPADTGPCLIPAQISALQALQALNIDGGSPSCLPPEISCLMGLTSIMLSDCLPCMRSGGKMTSLRKLSLISCR